MIDISKIKSGDRVRLSLYGLPESDWLEVTGTTHGCPVVRLPDGTRYWIEREYITAHEPSAPALPDWWGAQVISDGADDWPYFYTYDRHDDGYRGSTGAFYGSKFFLTHTDVTVVVDRDGNQPAVSEVKAALANAERRAEDYAGRYETSHASRMHAEECLRRTEAERDEARAYAEDYRRRLRDVDRAFAEFRAEVEKTTVEDSRLGAVREGDGFTIEVNGVKIAKCDTYGRTKADRDLEAFRAEVAKVRDDLRNVRSTWGADRLTAILDGTDQ